MLAPSKTIPINESTLYKAAKLISKMDSDIHLIDLFTNARKDFIDLIDFMDTLDLLFILRKIDFDEENGVIKVA